MDPWSLLRFPVLMVKLVVGRLGWKPVLIGWGLCIPLIAVLSHYT